MLYLAEKPELARAIAEALGGGSRKEGYLDCGRDTVTWCFGHMLELYDPADYDPRYKRWSLDDLPLFFTPWKKKPQAKAKAQLTVILKLLKTTDCVVNAGDPDAEGQLLVDEILRYAGFSGRVLRVLINDNTPALVKKAIANLRDNGEFAGLSAAAEARQIGDAVYGFNLTRLYTLAGRREGNGSILSVGRVQTPVLGLVVRRDREYAEHRKVPYYTVTAEFSFGVETFAATYQNRSDDPQDNKGRLTDFNHAKGIADSVAGKPARVATYDVTRGETPPPLPYNLLKLQTDASRQFGLSPDNVKNITQSLREKHRLITYNRSDSQYLSDEQHTDAPAVIAAVFANLPDLANSAVSFDPRIKSRAFNSAKVTAHHAIIPTQAKMDIQNLSQDERRIYQLIANAYLVQFLPNCLFDRTRVVVEVDGKTFAQTFCFNVSLGWKVFSRHPSSETEGNDDVEEENAGSVVVAEDQPGTCVKGDCTARETAPKPIYTMASLLEDLTRVAQYVRDENLRKLLVEKDRDKAGEHGGIGTPATRDVIIKTLLDRGFIEERSKGKTRNVVSTQAGRDFYDALPDNAKFPDLTALWHRQQLDIERGELSADAFLEQLAAFVGGECARVMKDGLGLKVEKFPCPACGNAMLRQKGKNGSFWGCSAFPGCRTHLPDDSGKPGAKRESPITSEIHNCGECGRGLVRRAGKTAGKFFWGCSRYPTCAKTYPDVNGKPNYQAGATDGKAK